MPNDKNKAAARFPNTRLIDRKVTAFAPAGIAIDFISLNSLPYAIDGIAFWAKQLSKMACPGCNVVGSLRISHEVYGTVIECRRGDRGLCDYEHEQLFNSKATQ